MHAYLKKKNLDSDRHSFIYMNIHLDAFVIWKVSSVIVPIYCINSFMGTMKYMYVYMNA